MTQDQRPLEATNNKHMVLLSALQREMVEMKQRNEEEICILKQENEDMRRKLERGHPSSPLEGEYQGLMIKM